MKSLKICFYLGLSVFSSTAFSFGGVVTDPGSYSYYALQIETAMKDLDATYEQVKVGTDQLAVVTDTYDELQKVEGNLTGQYNRATKALNRFKDMEDLSDFQKATQFANRTLKSLVDHESYVGDIEDNLEELFGNDLKDSGWINLSADKKAAKQASYKNAIISAELAKGKSNLQLERIKDYAGVVNSTANIKDSQDVSNTLLLEMLNNQRELIDLVASVSKNLALSQYDGGENKKINDTSKKEKDITDKTAFEKPSSGIFKCSMSENIKGECSNKASKFNIFDQDDY